MNSTMNKSLRKKYKRWDTAFQWSDYITATCTTISVTAAVGCIATNVLLPFTLPLGITSGSLSVVAFLSTRVKNRILAKITRNERIIVLVTAKINSVSELISKVINDNTVTDDEYKLILQEYDKYVELKKDVKTTKSNTHISKDVHTREFQERFTNDLKTC